MKKTVKSVAKMAVPICADWSVIDLLQKNGSVKRIAIEHINPDVKLKMKKLEEFPPERSRPSILWSVLKHKKMFYIEDFNEIKDKSYIKNKEHHDILQELGIKTLLVVPLHARSKILGTMTFIMGHSKRKFTSMILI